MKRFAFASERKPMKIGLSPCRHKQSQIAIRPEFILALDQGTTSSRAIVFDRTGSIKAKAQREVTQHYPRPGWVEHDANELWATQAAVAAEAVATAGIRSSDLACLGITNQRETTVVW